MELIDQSDNMYYKIKDTKYDGNCFFLAVNYGLQTIDVQKSDNNSVEKFVNEVRTLISNDASQNNYDAYKERYVNLKTYYDNIVSQLKERTG